MTERERVKRRLKKGYRRLLAECEQAICDAHCWAEHHPKEKPIDPEWFIVQAAGLRKALAAIENDERIDPSWIQTS